VDEGVLEGVELGVLDPPAAARTTSVRILSPLIVPVEVIMSVSNVSVLGIVMAELLVRSSPVTELFVTMVGVPPKSYSSLVLSAALVVHCS
jgi:hypothetical protein